MSLLKCNFDFVSHYKKDLPVLKMLCMWMYDGVPKSIFYLIYFFVINVFVVSFNIFQSINLFVNSDSLMHFAAVGYVVPISLMSNVKLYYIFKNRKHFNNLYALLNKDIFQPTTVGQLLMIRDSLKFHSRVKLSMLGFCTVTILSSMVTPIFYKKNEQNLPFAAWYPIDISAKATYVTIYVYQCFSVSYVSYINIYIEILLVGFTTFIALQCDLLCDNLRKINTSDQLQMKEALKICINHHWEILRFAKCTEKVFNQIYFGTFFCNTLVYCMTLFLLSLVKRDNIEFFYLLMYQISMFGLFLIPCWFSTEVTKKSENIPLAAYECSWPDASISFKKELIYFIHRTQMPIKLYAIDFFHISVETFVWIFRTSLSYYAVLNNLNSEE